jgi:hypothetical protein
MWTPTDLEAVVAELAHHPELDALTALIFERALAAADRRDRTFAKFSATDAEPEAADGPAAPASEVAAAEQSTATQSEGQADEGRVKSGEPSGGQATASAQENASGEPAQDRVDSDTQKARVADSDKAAQASGTGDTPYGNVRRVLERGAETKQQTELLSALLAMSLKRLDADTVDRIAPKLVWLATHTPVNALLALDAALGERADRWWTAIADVANRPAVAAPDFGWGEALSAAAALRSSHSAAAQRELQRLVDGAENPALQTLLTERREVPNATLTGELTAPPRGPVLTTVLAFTLVLFVLQLGRLIGRFALSYRRPAELYLTARGLELKHRTELLGKVMRDRVTLVPLGNVARVTREVRFSRLGLYAGLGALVIGTYFGVSLLIDAVRVPDGSPPLFGLGILFILLGLLLDFALSTLADSARGKCRLVVVPRKGKPFCIGSIDAQHADAMLSSFNAAL